MHGLPGARRFRRALGDGARARGAGVELLEAAIATLQAAALEPAARAPLHARPAAAG